MTKTAVVILNYNGANYLRKFLPSVIEFSGDSTIIVADNKSTDNSIAVLTKEFPQVRILPLEENYGFAGGYNEALEQIESEYIVLLNSDVEVTPRWLVPMVSFLDENPDYAGCQPKIKDYHDQSKFEYAGASGGFIDRLGYPYCRGRIFDTLETDAGQYDEEADIFWTSGACMIIRNKLYKQAGGLDSDFFAHMEEIDLCWRIQSLGYKFKAIPCSVVFHVGGGTLSKLNPLKTFLNFRNGLYMLIKNLPAKHLLYKLPVRIFLDWIASIKFLVEGNHKHSRAVIGAHFKALGSLRKTIRKRGTLSNLQIRKIIIVRYYLQNRKKFDKI